MKNNKKYKFVDTLQDVQGDNFSVVSLFSGCGGMDLGFEGDFYYLGKHYKKNPFTVIYANDIDKKAVETYNYNFPNQSECLDIKNKNISDIPCADVVIGGFPCQDFSVSGKRLGLKSDRGRLFLEMKSVIKHLQPKAFIAENVEGIKNSKNINGESALKYIIREFESIGYSVVYNIINAKYFGVPQNRTRVIIIGIRKDIFADIYYPKPILSENNFITSYQAIDDLWNKIDNTNISNHKSSDYSKAKFYFNKKIQGNVKIVPDKPAPTIRAEHHGNIEGHYRSIDGSYSDDINSWRRLSVRECARLQSFPDSFIFPCSATHAYRQIGNAVPPVLAWHIARALYFTINNQHV